MSQLEFIKGYETIVIPLFHILLFKGTVHPREKHFIIEPIFVKI